MSLQALRRLFGDDIVIQRTICFSQRWRTGSEYSDYLTYPRPDHALAYVMSESVEYTLQDGKTLQAPHGSILFLPKGSHYKIQFGKQSDSETDMFLINFLLDRPCPVRTPLLLYSDSTHELLPEFHQAIRLYLSSANISPALKAKIYQIIDLVLFSDTAGAPEEDSVRIGLLYIENNLAGSLKIAELAAMCHMSESSFRRAFSSLTGMSPLKYIHQQKIRKAKELLCDPECSIACIPEMLNFSDLSHFYKIFAEIEKCTPGEYRRHLLTLKS